MGGFFFSRLLHQFYRHFEKLSTLAIGVVPHNSEPFGVMLMSCFPSISVEGRVKIHHHHPKASPIHLHHQSDEVPANRHSRNSGKWGFAHFQMSSGKPDTPSDNFPPLSWISILIAYSIRFSASPCIIFDHPKRLQSLARDCCAPRLYRWSCPLLYRSPCKLHAAPPLWQYLPPCPPRRLLSKRWGKTTPKYEQPALPHFFRGAFSFR